MNFELSQIYPITDETISGISHAEQVEKLISGGAEIIQLREKLASPRVFYESAIKSLEIARKHGVKIIINDRVDIALASKADGVHLGQEDLPPKQAREILGPKAIIGLSTHSVGQAVRAINSPIDYLAVGPIFPTHSKENPDAVIGLKGLGQIRSRIGAFPLVAIGGINSDNVLSVFDAGADSVAMIGALLSDPIMIGERTRSFIRIKQQTEGLELKTS